jgi:hypothetical protein
MAVSEKLKQNFYEYAKVEDEDNGQAASILEAAIQKAEIETGKKFDEEQPLYVHVVKMIAQDWYDHRGNITTENIHELPLTIGAQVVLNQIAISSEFSRKEMKS